MRASTGGRDYAWAAMTFVMLLLFLGALINAVWALATGGSWVAVVGVPVAAIFYWWLGMGAWRRTAWGSPRT